MRCFGFFIANQVALQFCILFLFLVLTSKMSNQHFLGSLFSLLVVITRIFIAYIEVLIKLFEKKKKKSVKNQNVLITGAAQGFGKELAIKFAELNANLALVDINLNNINKTKDEIASKYPSIKIYSYVIDITEEQKLVQLEKKVNEDLGSIDILINNAGIVQCQPFLKLSSNLIERTFRVNSLAHIWTIKHFLPSMIKKKRGHIVAIASVAGLSGAKYLTDYW